MTMCLVARRQFLQYIEGGTSGRVLLRGEDRVVLFEVQSRRVLGELNAPKLKFVVWSPSGDKVALVCKFGVIIADRSLEQLSSVSDTVRIKSGAWDVNAQDLFVYTTLHHVKYCLPSGDSGTIRTLDQPVYAQRVMGESLFCLDREARPKVISIDATKSKFKLALHEKRYGEVMHMVRHSRLCGRAIVAYLQTKGFPEVALHFVREPRTRFRLALACGNIEAAMESAFSLESNLSSGETARDIWGILGSEALRQGNHQVVEMSYQRTKDFDRLSFLYLITGDTEKLKKMLKISQMRSDVMGRYYNALLLGNAEERVKVLEESGNLSLAYIQAKTHGLEEDAERVKVAIETNNGSVEGLGKSYSFLSRQELTILHQIIKLRKLLPYKKNQKELAFFNHQLPSLEQIIGQHSKSRKQLSKIWKQPKKHTRKSRKKLLWLNLNLMSSMIQLMT